MKDTNNETYMSNSETSIFSVVSSYNHQKSLSKTELVERYKHIIIRSVEFIFALGMSNNVIAIKKKSILFKFVFECQVNKRERVEKVYLAHKHS